MRIAFRVDASRAMGLGHLKRCLSLAQALQSLGAECSFHVRAVDLDSAALVRQAGFAAHVLPTAEGSPGQGAEAVATTLPNVPHAGWLAGSPEADARALAEALRARPPDAVVVDHYALDARWHDIVRAAWGCPVAVIDDLADRPLAPDLLIDHNPSRDAVAKYAAVLRRHPQWCTGPAFALLDPLYREHAPLPWRREVASVGIFMGGVDAGDHSSWVLQACRTLAQWQGPVEIAITSAHPDLPGLQRLAAQDTQLVLRVNAPHLADFHASHDVQVGAGGGALWERCALGVPTIALICAENQRSAVPLLAEAGVLWGLDAIDRSADAAATLSRLLRRLIDDSVERRRLRERSLQLVDGCGATRVALALLNLVASGRRGRVAA